MTISTALSKVLGIVVLPALFILRSLLMRGKAESTESPRPAPRGLLIVFGIILGTAVSIAWWRLFDQLTLLPGIRISFLGENHMALAIIRER